MKQNNAILAFGEKDAALRPAGACIRCGRCIAACPMNLMPTSIARQVSVQNAEELERLSVMTCMECGSCAYVCPACRPIVQVMRQGKNIVRAAQAANRQK